MYGLPPSTERHSRINVSVLNRQLGLKTKQRADIVRDIARVEIVAVVSTYTIPALRMGLDVKEIYVVEIGLKRKDYGKDSILLIAENIPQRMLFVLCHDGEACFAICHGGRLFVSAWQGAGDIALKIDGNDMDMVWQNFVTQVGNITIEEGNTLDRQIEIDTRRANLRSQIDRLRRKSMKEQQPRRKVDIHNQMLTLKEELDKLP